MSKLSRKKLKRIQAAILLNRKQSYDYTQKIGEKQLRKELLAARALIKRKLAKLPSRIANGGMDRTAMRAIMVELNDTINSLSESIGSSLAPTLGTAYLLGSDDTLTALASMDQQFKGIVTSLRLAPASQLNKLVVGKRASVLRRLATDLPDHPIGKGILRRYGFATIDHFEEQLRKGMIAGSSFKEMRKMLTAKSTWLQATPAYWAQRIVRTETMGAYNRASLSSGKEVERATKQKMIKVLSAFFDERTGWDSYQVHGQIRYLDDPFEWVTKKGESIFYDNPPNRPNDREVVIFLPSMKEITPDLEPVSESEYEEAFSSQNKSGSAPDRPKMTP